MGFLSWIVVRLIAGWLLARLCRRVLATVYSCNHYMGFVLLSRHSDQPRFFHRRTAM